MKKILLLDGHGTITYPQRRRTSIYEAMCEKQDITYFSKKTNSLIDKMRKTHFSFLKEKMKNNKTIKWEEDKKEWFRLESEIFKEIGIKGDYNKISDIMLSNFMNPTVSYIPLFYDLRFYYIS